MVKVYKMDTSFNITITPLPAYTSPDFPEDKIYQVKWDVRKYENKAMSTEILDGAVDSPRAGYLLGLNDLLSLAKKRAEAYVDLVSQHTLKYTYPEPVEMVGKNLVGPGSRATTIHAVLQSLKNLGISAPMAQALTETFCSETGLVQYEGLNIWRTVYGK